MSETLKSRGFRLTYRDGEGWNWRQDIRSGDFDATDLSEESFDWVVRKLEEISNIVVASVPDAGNSVGVTNKATKPNGWFIREEDGRWTFTDRRIAATAALTEGFEVVAAWRGQ